MTQEMLLGLVTFAFVTSVTPGPNNLMLMASGANFGVRRTLPHAAGVAIGFVVMAIAMGAGLHRLFVLWPPAALVLKAAAIGYMLWLAWKIAHAAAPGEAGTAARPMTFWQAVLFQWVNPKAWSMAVTATTVYVADSGLAAIVLASVIFGMVNLPSVGLWAVAGQTMRQWLTNPARLRAFNWTMAALLVASLWPILTH
jgi:threonine/homoserine/homoserine lactone efflux protein